MPFTTQSITTADTNTIITFDSCNSIVFTNANTSGDVATIDLWISGTGSTFKDATCDYNNDPTITHDDDSGKISVGMLVSGTGIPDGASVASVTSDTEFELSVSTTGGAVIDGSLTFLTDIVATGTLINLASGIFGYATGHISAMVVDGDNATAAEFLNERIYKSDGTFIGKCTAVGSTTSITISGGTEAMLANNDNLYVGNRYYLLNNVVIPNGASLKLEGDEINFDTNDYILLATTNAVNLDIITR